MRIFKKKKPVFFFLNKKQFSLLYKQVTKFLECSETNGVNTCATGLQGI